MEKVLKYSTAISAFLIFMGFLKLKFYYDNFNINIINYVEITEIITSFLNDINTLVFVLIIILFQIIINEFLLGNLINLSRKKKKDSEIINRYFEKYYLNKKAEKILLFCSIPLSILSYILYVNFSKLIFIFLFTIFVLYILAFIFNRNTIMNPKLGLLLIMLTMGIILPYSLAHNEYNKTIKKDYSSYKFITDNKVYLFDNNDIFIGKVKNYIFIKQNNKTSIIRASSVNTIEF